MRVSSNQERDSFAPQRLCDNVHATLATTFMPARRLLSWADQSTVVPGFQVRSTGTAVVVRYVQPRNDTRSLRRTHARTMIEKYSASLVAAGIQVEIVDESSKMPYLRCHPANNIMSNEGVSCPIL